LLAIGWITVQSSGIFRKYGWVASLCFYRVIAFIFIAAFIMPAEPLYPLPRYSGGGLGWGFFLEFGDTAPLPNPPPEYRGREEI
jgi:hypothetical protein